SLQRLAGVSIEGELDPSFQLIDSCNHQMETSTIFWLAPSKCAKRETEVIAGFRDKPTTLQVEQNAIKLRHSPQPLECDTSDSLKCQWAWMRRGLAYDQCNKISYGTHQQWVQRLLDSFSTAPPPGYNPISLTQCIRADKELFLSMSQENLSSFKPGSSGGLPLDALMGRLMYDVRIGQFLLPLPKGCLEHLPVAGPKWGLSNPCLRCLNKRLVDLLARDSGLRRVQGHGGSRLGLGAYWGMGKLAIFKSTYAFPQSCKYLCALVHHVAPKHVFGAIDILDDVLSEVHQDLTNQKGSCSLVVPLTHFAQGQLWIEDETGNHILTSGRCGRLHNFEDGPCVFDLRLPVIPSASEGPMAPEPEGVLEVGKTELFSLKGWDKVKVELATRQDHELELAAWEETRKELDAGWSWLSDDKSNKGLLIALRFALRQSPTKIRLIDDCTINGLNGTIGLRERFELHTIDKMAAMAVRALGSAPDEGLADWVGRTFDLRSAYKQYGIHPSDRQRFRIGVNRPGCVAGFFGESVDARVMKKLFSHSKNPIFELEIACRIAKKKAALWRVEKLKDKPHRKKKAPPVFVPRLVIWVGSMAVLTAVQYTAYPIKEGVICVMDTTSEYFSPYLKKQAANHVPTFRYG
ncbi:unnamed protein product, partial [Symbiodinium pilosum]